MGETQTGNSQTDQADLARRQALRAENRSMLQVSPAKNLSRSVYRISGPL